VYTASYDDVYAIDETTGVELWSVDVNPTSYQISGGPTFANGKLYVGTQEGYLYCLNATTGQQIWYWPTGALPGYIATSPVVANGKVYFGTADYSSPSVKNYLIAVNATTGVEVWRYIGAGDKILASPAVDGTWIFFGSDYDKVYALNDTGSSFQVKWTYTTSGNVRSTPCVSEGKVFFGTYSTDHSVFALNKTTGAMVWKYTTLSAYSIDTSVSVANDILYFTSLYYYAYALNASAPSGNYTEGGGSEYLILIWRTQQITTYPNKSPAITDDKMLLTAGYVLRTFNVQTGVPMWSYNFASGTIGEPVVADGRIFITKSNMLYSFGDFYPPNTYDYPVSGTGYDYVVKVDANATVKNFNYSSLESEKKLTYILEANWVQDITVMSNITIPNDMLGGPYTVTVDGASPTTKSEHDNGTHTTISFTYLQFSHNDHVVEVTGTTVIPEFPTTIMLAALITISLIAVTLAKKKLPKN
jgi:outer membrane protein assembly factor BamB